MSDLKTARLVAVLAPRPGEASFVTPVFSDQSEHYIQSIQGGIVTGFEPIRTGDAELTELPDAAGQVDAAVGESPVYAFAFGANDVVAAPRAKLTRVLAERFRELKDAP